MDSYEDIRMLMLRLSGLLGFHTDGKPLPSAPFEFDGLDYCIVLHTLFPETLMCLEELCWLRHPSSSQLHDNMTRFVLEAKTVAKGVYYYAAVEELSADRLRGRVEDTVQHLVVQYWFSRIVMQRRSQKSSIVEWNRGEKTMGNCVSDGELVDLSNPVRTRLRYVWTQEDAMQEALTAQGSTACCAETRATLRKQQEAMALALYSLRDACLTAAAGGAVGRFNPCPPFEDILACFLPQALVWKGDLDADRNSVAPSSV